MRSRYSAFALKQTDHLWSTMHSTHPDRLRSRDNVIRELKKNCNRYSYPQLEILKVEEPGADGAAYVTFRAGVLDGAQAVGFVERSRFLKEAEGWRYVDGTPGTP